MRGLKWQLAAASATASLALGSIALANPTAAASIERCGSVIDNRPVVLTVHGLAGSPKNFGLPEEKNTMNKAIGSIGQVNLVEPFNYERYNKKWVTDPHLGAALASKINCLSSASREAGGNGKIAVVANSLGALVLRQALNPRAATRTSTAKVGLAVMIGAPHKGTVAAVVGMAIYWDCTGQICQPSAAAKALVPNSRQLQALPPLPATVPQRVIATDIVKGSAHLGDLVVPVGSATAMYTTRYRGDGKFVIRCGWSQASLCQHGNLLKNTAVQRHVVAGLNEYAPRVTSPSPSPSTTPTPTATPTPSCSASPTPSEEANGGVGGGPTATPC